MGKGEAAKHWTTAEQCRLIDLYKVKDSSEIALILGRTKQAVESRLTKLRAEGKVAVKRALRNWTPKEDEQLFLLTSTEASAKLGRTVEACQKRRRALKRLAKTAKGDSK